MSRRKWLVINYNLPTEPSRPRVALWRRLKKLGALNVQQSMWILVHNKHNYAALQEISRDIEANNGEALLMESVFFDAKHEDRIISSLNNVRDEEYKELINECEKYLNEIKKEISIAKFTFAELEEEEEELQKLMSWYNKIEARQILPSLQGDTAKKKVEQIKKAFEDYSELVYQHHEK